MIRARLAVLALLAALVLAPTDGAARDGPSYGVRGQVQKSLVRVTASGCADRLSRTGSGFAFEQAGQVVTAHHVVGGCADIKVIYEGSADGMPRTATVRRVLASGDLALLAVQSPPAVPALKLAVLPADRSKTYAGFGYQNGQPTPGDLLVTFSTGPGTLQDILPYQARSELTAKGSRIQFTRTVLRFNIALQPGMSGGPIIDDTGNVIGVVAGGLKAGAAPASWGWPAEWLQDLFASTEAANQAVHIAGVYYSNADFQLEETALNSGRQLQCGDLTLSFRGTRTFGELARTSDDQARLNHLIGISGQSRQELDTLTFDLWTERGSGATAVLPAGYTPANNGPVCYVGSSTGPFIQVIWGTFANNPSTVQVVSTGFENNVMAPLAAYPFGFTVDAALTTGGPQFRPNGMVFTRKGFSQPKQPWQPGWPPVPLAHTFETLIANSGTFLGVGTLNNEVPPALAQCHALQFQTPWCAPFKAHLREWTHFILATQLSTYPAT